jgi:hypothetical protein
MKQYMKWLTGALVVAGGLVIVSPVQAQSVMNLSTINPSTFIPNVNIYQSWATATFTSQPSGLEVVSSGYGSGYFNVPTPQILATNDTTATLTLTVNNYAGVSGFAASATGIWVGLPFLLDDNSNSAVSFGGYSGPGNGGNPDGTTWSTNVVDGVSNLVCTETVNLNSQPALLATIQAGGDAITGFNLETDPTGTGAAYPYDITFNSLVLSAPAPVGLPTIAVAQSGTTLTLSWNSTAYPNYVLQACTNSAGITANSSWSNVSGGDTSPVAITIDPTQPAVFFRLNNP